MVAHELRGPLSALATSSEILVEDLGTLDPEQVARMAGTIHRGVLWLQGLVENLLCAASNEEGRFFIQPQPMSLDDVLLEMRPVVEPLLAQREQQLRLLWRRSLPEVCVDGRRIGQVLVNLILNASKFAGPRTAIDVLLTMRGDRVRVVVADRGPGIPAEHAARLFAPYVQGPASPLHGRGGVGLGLAIVRSIIEAHGGRVGAENRRGGGARFWFELPAASGHMPSAGAEGSA
jgi:two-component system sensor histidine kinase KdpD